MAKERTYPIRADVIERLREARGLSVAKLAERAGIDAKTLKRIQNGGNAFLETIQRIAKALNATPDSLRADIEPEGKEALSQFTINISVTGTIRDTGVLAKITQLTPKLIAMLTEQGVSVDEHRSSIELSESVGDEWIRNIGFLFLIFADGKTGWVMTAIKTYLWQSYCDFLKSSDFDLRNLSTYGDALFFGDGNHPSDDFIHELADSLDEDKDTFLKRYQEVLADILPWFEEELKLLKSNHK